MRNYTAHHVLGKEVRDSDGERLGTIAELVLDRVTGRVSFAIIALDDEHRADGAYLPVPWTAMTPGADDEFQLTIGGARLDAAPTLGWEDIDELHRRARGVEIFTYFGIQPPWESSPDDRTEHSENNHGLH